MIVCSYPAQPRTTSSSAVFQGQPLILGMICFSFDWHFFQEKKYTVVFVIFLYDNSIRNDEHILEEKIKFEKDEESLVFFTFFGYFFGKGTPKEEIERLNRFFLFRRYEF